MYASHDSPYSPSLDYLFTSFQPPSGIFILVTPAWPLRTRSSFSVLLGLEISGHGFHFFGIFMPSKSPKFNPKVLVAGASISCSVCSDFSRLRKGPSVLQSARVIRITEEEARTDVNSYATVTPRKRRRRTTNKKEIISLRLHPYAANPGPSSLHLDLAGFIATDCVICKNGWGRVWDITALSVFLPMWE